MPIVDSVKVVDDVDPVTGEGGGIKADVLPDVVDKLPPTAVVVDGALPPRDLAHASSGLIFSPDVTEFAHPCAKGLRLRSARLPDNLPENLIQKIRHQDTNCPGHLKKSA